MTETTKRYFNIWCGINAMIWQLKHTTDKVLSVNNIWQDYVWHGIRPS